MTSTKPAVTGTFRDRRPLLILAAIIAFGLALRMASSGGYQGGDDCHYIVHAYLFCERGLPGIEHVTAWLGRIGVWLPMALCIRLFGPGETSLTLYPLICSVAGLILTYQLGRLLFDARIALLGTFFLAIFPLDVIFSTLPYADVPFGLFMLLTLYLFLLAERRGRTWCFLASGVAAGIAWLHKEPAVFLIFPFVGLLLIRRAFRKEYLLVLLGGVLVLVCESTFWGALVDDPLYRFKTILAEREGIDTQISAGPPLWKVLLQLHQGSYRETIALVEPVVMFATNQEFGLFYYFVWPAALYYVWRRQRELSDVLIWTLGLGLFMCWFPIFFPYTLARDPRYFTPLSGPAVLILAYACWQWRPYWRRALVGALIASSLFCVYVDGSRLHRNNERELLGFRKRCPNSDVWVGPTEFANLLVLDGFRDDPGMKMHLLSGGRQSHAAANVKMFRPAVEVADTASDIPSGFVVVRISSDGQAQEVTHGPTHWSLVTTIPEARPSHPIGEMMQNMGVPPKYVNRLFSPGSGARLAVWRVGPNAGGGRRSEVGGRRSEVGGRRTEDGGRRTEVGGRRSEVGRPPVASSDL